MEFNNEIKLLIKKHGYLVKDIAKKLNTSPENLSNKLRRKSIKYIEIEKILDILGYEIIWKKKD